MSYQSRDAEHQCIKSSASSRVHRGKPDRPSRIVVVRSRPQLHKRDSGTRDSLKISVMSYCKVKLRIEILACHGLSGRSLKAR